jgi:ABC-type nitrate/sulfonate/bicarbonate transport system substrate-binding protein/ABC-type nitrate/sulfonate/bicarbonate transport system ATPase subunit
MEARAPSTGAQLENSLAHLAASRLSLQLPEWDAGGWPLTDLDLKVEEGASLAVMASRAGIASGLLRALGGELSPERGGVLLHGRELRLPDGGIVSVGRLPRCGRMRTVAGYLCQAADLTIGRRLTRQARDRWVAHNLRLVGAEDLAGLRISRLSDHGAARIQLAYALTTDAPLLFLDHLFDHLDERARKQCMDLLLEIQSRSTCTLVLATDDVEQAILFSDRVLCLTVEEGRITPHLAEVDLLHPRARVDLARGTHAQELVATVRGLLGRRTANDGEHLAAVTGAPLAPETSAVVDMAEWVASRAPRGGKVLEKQHLSLGFLPLIDCAPLAVALEEGFFEAAGLRVTLSRESSWSNVQDKVALGLLDGAQMLAAMPLAAAIDQGSAPLVTALGLGRNGNAVTVSTALFERLGLSGDLPADALQAVQALRAEVDRRRAERRRHLVFAMVGPHSSHNYLLRYWLGCGGIDPDRDIKLVVVPPPQMVNYLGAGMIDGFCVGEPWNTAATEEGIARTQLTTSQIWTTHFD